jgi:hypothetical protein
MFRFGVYIETLSPVWVWPLDTATGSYDAHTPAVQLLEHDMRSGIYNRTEPNKSTCNDTTN